ncbi:right-handed parallel beta-helix repeat-containing protein [Spirosoma spitsbergense]|uniref:right-handed parallel beta-helix repeat-containing protein n=1 Tax=Spirosoma spitsbergense TaxID=431554 RepID=UPI00035CBFAA|nr:right-handed parallel beta-helix repeat-containing protein [Spirosoma spitsbergense]
MKNSQFVVFLLLFVNLAAHDQTWYVSGTGNDTNDGKTEKTAFRNLQKAADLVQPGEVVLIGNGIYTNSDKGNGSAVLNITRSGKDGAWITWKALPGQHPEIRPTGWAGIQISGSYHIFDGLRVIGSNDSIVLLKAQEDARKPKPDPYFNTNGIFFNGRGKKPDEKPHHLVIRNCEVAKCPGGGIVGIEIDYFTVEDCRVYNNAWFMRYGGSGITTLNNWAHDDAPGYHVVIQRNYVWNNKTLVPWEQIGKLSDGNGIILDVTDQEQGQGATNPNADAVVKPDSTKPAPAAKPKRPEWKGRALIADNISAFNGGSGIHTFRTRHVDIINNTTYWNGGIVGYPELFANRSTDVVIMNNIITPRPAGKVTSNNRNTDVKWDYNLYPVAQNVLVGTNDIIADPNFIDVETDITKGNFRLTKDSKGHNTGSAAVALKTDITGKARPKGPGRDRGAFEQ